MSDAAKIIEFLKARAEEASGDDDVYLLSDAGPDMVADGIDYRAILAGERLKAFVERTAPDGGYRLVQHPRQRAKLGVVPVGKDFEFKDEPVAEVGTEVVPREVVRSAKGAALFDFLHALSKLPPDEIDGVVIPTRVLVKLALRK